jgi:hypothetical protein
MTDGDLDEARRLTDAAIAVAPIGTSARFRALSNRAIFEYVEGDTEGWQPLVAAAVEEAERAGDRPNLRWLEWMSIHYALLYGRWDEAVRRVDEQVALGPHYTLDSLLHVKAYLLAARDQLGAARACRDEGLVLTEKIPDEQSAIPGFLEAAWASLVIGEEELAARLVDRVLPLVQGMRHRAPGIDAANTVVAIRSGRGQDYFEVHRHHADTRRVRAALLLLEGRVIEGADAWALVSPHDGLSPGSKARGSSLRRDARARPTCSSSAASPSSAPSVRRRWCATRRACSRRRPRSGQEPQRRNELVSPCHVATPPSTTGRASTPAACSTLAAIAARGPDSQIVTTGRPFSSPASAAARAVR